MESGGTATDEAESVLGGTHGCEVPASSARAEESGYVLGDGVAGGEAVGGDLGCPGDRDQGEEWAVVIGGGFTRADGEGFDGSTGGRVAREGVDASNDEGAGAIAEVGDDGGQCGAAGGHGVGSLPVMGGGQ